MRQDLPIGRPTNFSGFDGLRAIAILLVILWHSVGTTGFPLAVLGSFAPLVKTGWAGVDLFFALSGFLITSLILREERGSVLGQGQPRFSLRRFYLRRALRILPVFYVVFLLNTYVFSGYLPSANGRRVLESTSPFGLWPYATFWGNYFAAYHSAFGRGTVYPGESYVVLWSLCVEEHFYLLWPGFLAVMKRLRTRVLVAAGVCLALAGLRYLTRVLDSQHVEGLQQLTHLRLDSILWGALGAMLVNHLPDLTRPRRVALGVCGLAIVWLVARGDLSMLPPPTALGSAMGLTLLAFFSTVLLFELVKSPNTWLVRALNWGPLALVGRLSYAMYLIHFQAIDLGRILLCGKMRSPTALNFILMCGLFVTLTLAAAALLHVLIELPFLRLKARFAPARTPSE